MYIAFCIQKIAGLSGGAERVLIDVANYFAGQGRRVEILTYEDLGDAPFYALHPSIVVRNIKPFDDRRAARAWRSSVNEGTIEYIFQKAVQLFERIPGLAHLVWRMRFGKMIHRIQQFIDWHKPDVLIPFMPGMFPYVVAARELADFKPKIVVSNHNLPKADFESKARWDQNVFDKRFRRKSIRKADAVIVLLPEYKAWFRPQEQRNIHVIGNIIMPPPTLPATYGKEKIFISVGRLTETKNHETLIRAFDIIKNDIPGWSVRIFGVGPLQDKLTELIKSLGLESRVTLMGRTDKIHAEYAQSSVFVLPSQHEGFPLVLGEAFGHGLPGIAFADCSGANFLIQHSKNGVLVEAHGDRVSNFAVAMREMALQDGLRSRLSTYAKQFVNNGEFSEANILSKWSNLIKLVQREAN